MRAWRLFLFYALSLGSIATATPEANPDGAGQTVFILPIRDDIMPPMVYLVRRGVKAAMDAKADYLVIDMETNGGRVDSTEKIIEVIAQFKGHTVTFVNRNAYSAGAFISVATEKIYMAPQAVIGAAAPIMLSPGGMGVEQMPNTVEVKMTSALSAKVRAYAQKNGHNPDVVEAMIDKQKELKIDGHVINEKGKILTLTNTEAEKTYGQPPEPLLSAGTVETLDALLAKLGLAKASRTEIKPTGAERVAGWITALNWLWLIIGAAGIYIEFKSPGFGLPGIIGVSAFAIYFLGSYVAGLSGLEWPLLFALGLVLVGLELLVFPGTIVLGLIGASLMLITVIMAMVDIYPGMPGLPSLEDFAVPFQNLAFAAVGTVAVIAVLGRWLPKTPVYASLVSQSESGVGSVLSQELDQSEQVGWEGVALSVLRPGGKAQFGDRILDVMSEGEMVPRGARVRVIRHSGREAIVTLAPERSGRSGKGLPRRPGLIRMRRGDPGGSGQHPLFVAAEGRWRPQDKMRLRRFAHRTH